MSTAVPIWDDLGSAAQRERRRRILDATLALASEGGFDAVQMRAVAERAEVALGTLYRYFPSKIHLLVSALGFRFASAQQQLDTRRVPGDTAAERVRELLLRQTRQLQRDPHMTEALTRAFMFADSTVSTEIEVVGSALTRMLTHAIRGEDYDPGVEPTDHEATIAKVLSDVWLSSLVSWVTGRADAGQVRSQLTKAVDLVLD